jgi:hypothetical protein
LKAVRGQNINEKQEEGKLDGLILSTFREVSDRIKRQWDEEAKLNDP